MNLLTEFFNMKRIIYMASFCLLALYSNQASAQSCPMQVSPQNQTNLVECMPELFDGLTPEIKVVDGFLEGDTPYINPCMPGDVMTMNIKLQIINESEDACMLGLFGKILAGTSSDTCDINMCSGTVLPKSMTADGTGSQVVVFGSVNYNCGESLRFRDISVVTADPTAVMPLTCNDFQSSSRYSVPGLTLAPPFLACDDPIVEACNDGNPCTTEDSQFIDPVTGGICMPCTGSGTADDCFVINLVPCNDNNPCTINDMQSIDACSGDFCAPCVGTPVESCSIFVNQLCNDNNPCTTDDIIVLDACSLEICIPCTGIPIDVTTCDPECEIYNPSTCSCEPIPIPNCDDNDCTTIDTYDDSICECVYIAVNPQTCDDGLCYTNDYLDPNTCNCVNEPIVDVICNDNNCATEDVFNYSTCECEYIDVCTNVESGGWIGYDQGNCGPFNPAPIVSLEPAIGGCGQIEYMWLQSPVNVPYYGTPNSYWSIIPNANGLSYDPSYQASGTMCYLRCARTETCSEFPGESNIICITVGEVQNCNDWNCTTEDYFNPTTCECEYTVISNPSCDDQNCGTIDSFNPETCECEYTPVCNNVTFPGNISGNQESCGPFDAAPITSVNLPAGGCGDIEYIWIQSHTNVFSGGGAGSPWTTIPGATGASYDPGIVSQTTYYRRCARSAGCVYYIGESNIICVEVGSSATCDDGNCNTLDTFDPLTCDCIHIDITPNCDDNDCSTEDIYDPLTCSCTHVPVSPVFCDDNDCNTIDTYDAVNCNCVYTVIPPPDCDDNNCATTDLYDVLTCECVNVFDPPVDCNDNNCATIDTYNAQTCQCEYQVIQLPDCDDNDCTTIDTYDPATCDCTNTPIDVANCDDNDCNTHDFYDTINCVCVHEVIPPPDCDDNNCNTEDSYNAETCLCENVVIDIPDCDDNDCNTEDIYDVTTCQCVNTPITPPDCDDNDCNTIDNYDSETCSCVYTVIPPPDCDDNDCNTDDFYDTANCECVNTISQVPDCDDNNCNTEDFYDVETCECVNTMVEVPDCDDNDCTTMDFYDVTSCNCVNDPITIPDCDDNDCSTVDSFDTATCTCVNVDITPQSCDDNDCQTIDTYNTETCECEYEDIPVPDCDDNDCQTLDTYNTATCECEYEDIPIPDCDDNDCTTMDVYNAATCECEYTVLPQEIVCNAAESFDLFLDDDGFGMITVDDVDNGSSIGCEGTLSLSLDITTFACNNVGVNEVKLTVSNGVDEECCSIMINVIDNNIPTILPGFCPADMTIDCDEDISDLSVFGDIDLAFLDDNCALSHTVIETSNFNIENCGTGSITRTFTLIDILGNEVIGANGQALSCDQVITLEGDANALTLGDITWPAGQVDVDCTDADNIPNTEPVIAMLGSGCTMISITSNDVIDNPNDDCSFTIERTWTVTDECQPQGSVFNFTQTINVSDSTAPTINDAPGDIDLDLTGELNTCSQTVTLDYNISDNCFDSDDLIVSIDAPGLMSQTDIDANGDISFDVEFCALTSSQTVTLTVSDQCGNVDTHSFNVSIIGSGCLELVCQKFIFELEADGSNEFIASEFPVVTNSCGHIDIQVSYDPLDINDTVINLGCDEIEEDGEFSSANNPNLNIFLYFWANDIVIDSCRSVIFFSNDPNGDGNTNDGWVNICSLSNFVGNVSGTVSNIMNEPVGNVEVRMDQAGFDEELTNMEGRYAFPVMDLGGDYEVIPSKDDDYLNGVTTLDVILIQKHILSLIEFDSPYKYIAGDVNQSNTVSALDIIILRKLILGIYAEFPDNTSWRMVDAEYDFTDPTNPLANKFPESYFINDMPSSMSVDFVGIKIGDVNGSVVNQFSPSSVSSDLRADSRLQITYDETHFQKGDQFDLTLRPITKAGFEGAQFALQLDPEVLEIKDVVLKDDALCGNENFNLSRIDEGLILMSYNTIMELDAKQNQSLFTVRVEARKDNSVSNAIAMDQATMKPESYFNSMVGEIQLMPQGEEIGGVILYQNKPNPWNSSTMIEYFVPADMHVDLNIYNINGQLIRSYDFDAKSGMNEFELLGSELNTNGVFYYEIITDGSKQVMKMLLLD